MLARPFVITSTRMILSDRDIKKHLEDGKISIDPYRPECVQPASIDLHLGDTFLIFDTVNHSIIDVKEPVDDLMRKVTISGDQPFILHPGEFALGLTLETVGVGNDMVGRLEGKSSLGRLGIIIHATAGYLDPGNTLKMTLELSNIGSLPVKLYHKMPIAQISFSPLSSAADRPYGKGEGLNSKYYGATEPQASQMHKNFTKE
jgi:dCTP deaminase